MRDVFLKDGNFWVYIPFGSQAKVAHVHDDLQRYSANVYFYVTHTREGRVKLITTPLRGELGFLAALREQYKAAYVAVVDDPTRRNVAALALLTLAEVYIEDIADRSN